MCCWSFAILRKARMSSARRRKTGCISASSTAAQALEPAEAVLPVFGELLYSSDNPELIRQAVSFTRDLLENIPVWMLRNKGDRDSAILAHETLSAYFNGGDI